MKAPKRQITECILKENPGSPLYSPATISIKRDVGLKLLVLRVECAERIRRVSLQSAGGVWSLDGQPVERV